MSPRIALIALSVALAAGLPILTLGAYLWSRAGVMVWLQGAIAYCF